jgi:hypothetical protein
MWRKLINRLLDFLGVLYNFEINCTFAQMKHLFLCLFCLSRTRFVNNYSDFFRFFLCIFQKFQVSAIVATVTIQYVTFCDKLK